MQINSMRQTNTRQASFGMKKKEIIAIEKMRQATESEIKKAVMDDSRMGMAVTGALDAKAKAFEAVLRLVPEKKLQQLGIKLPAEKAKGK
jgi:hypothetical protein